MSESLSERLELDQIKHLFRMFLQNLNACPPSCAGMYEPDLPVEPSVNVDRSDALDCFLRKNPSYERFRDDLTKVHHSVKWFTFNKSLWNSIC
jgi:hypothetical protein